MRISDWSSDVCSSDLVQHVVRHHRESDVPAERLAVALVQPAAFGEFRAEVGLELQLHQLRVAHATSFRPVTTSEMSAVRRSMSSAFSSATFASMASIDRKSTRLNYSQ